LILAALISIAFIVALIAGPKTTFSLTISFNSNSNQLADEQNKTIVLLRAEIDQLRTKIDQIVERENGKGNGKGSAIDIDGTLPNVTTEELHANDNNIVDNEPLTKEEVGRANYALENPFILQKFFV
jgi:hypothetical protein